MPKAPPIADAQILKSAGEGLLAAAGCIGVGVGDGAAGERAALSVTAAVMVGASSLGGIRHARRLTDPAIRRRS